MRRLPDALVEFGLERAETFGVDAMVAAFDLYLAEQAGLYLESLVEKGGMIAFALLFAQFPWVRLWQRLSRYSRIPLLHPYNPAVYFPVILPQLIYLAGWKRKRGWHGAGFHRPRTLQLAKGMSRTKCCILLVFLPVFCVAATVTYLSYAPVAAP